MATTREWRISRAAASIAFMAVAGAAPALTTAAERPGDRVHGAEARAERALATAERALARARGNPVALVRAGSVIARAHVATWSGPARGDVSVRTTVLALRTVRLSGTHSRRLVIRAVALRGPGQVRAARRALSTGSRIRLSAARRLAAASRPAADRHRRALAAELARGHRFMRAHARTHETLRALRPTVRRSQRIELMAFRLLRKRALGTAPRRAPRSPGAQRPTPPAAVPPVPTPAPASPAAPEAAAPVEYPVATTAGIVYSTPAFVTSLAMDAHVPQGTSASVPAVVLVHGGAWRGGGRQDMALQAKALARHGYAAFSIDYRKTSPRPFPDQYADVASAIAWVRANGRRFGVDPQRVATLGASAGGHLSAMVGLTDAAAGVPGGRPDAVVSWSGVMDLRDMVTNTSPRPGCSPGPVSAGGTCELPAWMSSQMPGLMGCPLTSDRMLLGLLGPPPCPLYYDANSPVRHVAGTAVPSLFIHTASDPLVHVDQAYAMTARLRAAGTRADMVEFAGEGHANQLHGIAIGPTVAFLRSVFGDPAAG